MKRLTETALVALLGIGILTGCGEPSYETDVSTVFVEKDGKIVSADVEAFDEDAYDMEGLEAFVKDALLAYNGGEEGNITMKSLTAEEGKATLILEYASASDYADFNGIELYTGTIADALSAGYAFDVEFAAVSEGKADVCDISDFLGNGDYRVVIIKGNTDVHVDGKVVCVSTANTSYVDENTIRIAEGTSLTGQPAADEEDTQSGAVPTEGTEAVPETEGTEAAPVVDDGSVSEDELLMDTEEEPQKVEFVFEEDKSASGGEESEFAEVCTYIIYR